MHPLSWLICSQSIKDKTKKNINLKELFKNRLQMLEMKESINEEPMDLTEIPQQQHALLIQTAGPFCGDQQSVTSRLEAFSPVKNNRKHLHDQSTTVTSHDTYKDYQIKSIFHSFNTRTQINV